MRRDADELQKGTKLTFLESPWEPVRQWEVDSLKPKAQLTYVWQDGGLIPPTDTVHQQFLQYLQLYEYDKEVRSDLGKEALQLPMLYMPVHRASGGLPSRIGLSGYSYRDQKRTLDVTTSRSGGTNVLSLAIGRLAQRYRTLEAQDNMSVRQAFYDDENLKALTEILHGLGYTWSLETINVMSNEYDVALTKQGTQFEAAAASSGERELLTYLFAIYALNVRDAVIVVDEPELHLHPRWQRTLFDLFDRLSRETGNQFVLATHSPTFISPASIQYVSRVYIEEQKSHIIRLNSAHLPDAKHLFNIVNSQNNERLFFCDRVVLVEGISDRIFFEKIFDRFGRNNRREVTEIISVGGKGFFAHYQKLLEACRVQAVIIADLDYIEQVGTADIKKLFRTDDNEIKKDVFDNIKSLDGQSFVARVEEAMSTHNWHDADELWSYIKSRRIRLRRDLSEDDEATLKTFLDEQRALGINILSAGALESYLPIGYRNKDLENLIKFLERSDYWDQLPGTGRAEIELIVETALAA